MAKTPASKRPADLKFSETHEWVRVEGSEAVVGISDYAVAQLSDLVSVELPKTGMTVEIETPIGEVESVKTVAELVSPISGRIVAVNKEVANNIDLLAKNPFDDGWLLRIKMKDAKDLDHLMTTREYDEYLKTLQQEHEEEEDDDEEDDDEDDDGMEEGDDDADEVVDEEE
jgi:glycine cleavage system H protein